MIINETLRLHPILPFIDRVSYFSNPNDTYTLEPFGDFQIPHNMPIIFPSSAIHRDPKLWPNPDIFDPERFSAENKVNIKTGSFIPFGIGPRECIGKRLAYIVMKTALVSFLRNHEVQLEDSMNDVEYSNTICFSIPKNVTLKLIRDV